ncbi:hypothetical protein QBC39DRAFT_404396 [Podospora conica]|nr:hypothetical protein QBC39DRAFT_404396 [Schizothecium conicum]
MTSTIYNADGITIETSTSPTSPNTIRIKAGGALITQVTEFPATGPGGATPNPPPTVVLHGTWAVHSSLDTNTTAYTTAAGKELANISASNAACARTGLVWKHITIQSVRTPTCRLVLMLPLAKGRAQNQQPVGRGVLEPSVPPFVRVMGPWKLFNQYQTTPPAPAPIPQPSTSAAQYKYADGPKHSWANEFRDLDVEKGERFDDGHPHPSVPPGHTIRAWGCDFVLNGVFRWLPGLSDFGLTVKGWKVGPKL